MTDYTDTKHSLQRYIAAASDAGHADLQIAKDMRQALAAIEELEARNQWQPIETVPKDKAVLIYAAGYYVAHFNTTNNRWWTQTDGTGTSGERILNSWGAPTHWMPLPQPPETPNDRA